MKRIRKKLNIYIPMICKTITNFIFIIFIYPFLKLNLKKNKVNNIKIYSYFSWHLGYKYFTGNYNNKKVFIKYNKSKKIINNEINNFNLLLKNKYLSKHIPALYITNKFGAGMYIVEEFLLCSNIEKLVKENYSFKEKVFTDFIKFINEFQNIGFMHLDINPKNLYLDSNDNIYLIDFGFSLTKGTNFEEIINSNIKRKFIIRHLNSFSRIDYGFIDDAVSFIYVSKYICNDFITKYNIHWKKMNELSNKLYYKREL